MERRNPVAVMNRHQSSAMHMSLVKEQEHSLHATFLANHPEGIVLTSKLRQQIAIAIKERDVPISIEGETGTGKEQIVRYIHSQMEAEGVPLVVINCANLSRELASATLFGHKKGAFTGAVDHAMGAVGRAHNGILFLDEFHRLETSIQEQILRTMQDGSYQRVGDAIEYHSQFRLIVATPRSLEQHALDGQVLMDLRFRLYGVEIKIPPLRERLDQMGDFIDCFLINCQRPCQLTDAQKQALIKRCSEFYWQGNIRQLFGILRMLLIQAAASDNCIRVADLPVYPTMLPPVARARETGYAADGFGMQQQQKTECDDELVTLVRNYSRQPGAYEDFLDNFEKVLLNKLSFQYRSVKSMCEALSLPRSTLHAKRRRLGLRVKDEQ